MRRAYLHPDCEVCKTDVLEAIEKFNRDKSPLDEIEIRWIEPRKRYVQNLLVNIFDGGPIISGTIIFDDLAILRMSPRSHPDTNEILGIIEKLHEKSESG